jgi:hypothetical protein
LAELMQLDTLYWPVVQIEQLVHMEPAVMPSPVEYVPDWQSVHSSEFAMPVPVWYVPGWHDRHELEFREARMVEYVPAIQEIHWLDEVIPVPVLYFPAGQASQFTPFQFAGGSSWVPTGKFCQVVFHPPTPVKPALQVQAVWVPALTV